MIAPVRSRVVVRIVATALATALLSTIATAAFAAMEDPPSPGTFSTTTNPGAIDDSEVMWRYGWGNSLNPTLFIRLTTLPKDGIGDPPVDIPNQGFYYSLDQSPFTAPAPGGHGHSFEVSQSAFNGSFDMLGIIDSGDVVPGAFPGATKLGEGLWWLHVRQYNQFRSLSSTATYHFFYGNDRTAPRPVSNLTATLGTVDTSTFTEVTRRKLSWSPIIYDDLAGVGGYKIAVNGAFRAFIANTEPDPAFEWWATPIGDGTAPQVFGATIEYLDPGANKIELTVVDRATNESTSKSVMAYVDPDSPTIAITNPAAGQAVPRTVTLRVKAEDAAGISKVSYFVDGIFVGATASAPYSLAVNLGDFANGTHTLKAVVEDMIGTRAGAWRVPHTATASTSFKLDKSAPAITNVSGGPTPFFPRLRDGYKDNHIARFTASEGGSASITIKDSKGKVWRKMSKKVSAGRNSFTWNGKSDSGGMKAGSFTWSIAMKDGAGNRAATGSRSTVIKFYEMVRVNGRSARIIPR